MVRSKVGSIFESCTAKMLLSISDVLFRDREMNLAMVTEYITIHVHHSFFAINKQNKTNKRSFFTRAGQPSYTAVPIWCRNSSMASITFWSSVTPFRPSIVSDSSRPGIVAPAPISSNTMSNRPMLVATCTGVHPSTSTGSGLAPRSSNRRTSSRFPFMQHKCNRLTPSWFDMFRSISPSSRPGKMPSWRREDLSDPRRRGGIFSSKRFISSVSSLSAASHTSTESAKRTDRFGPLAPRSFLWPRFRMGLAGAGAIAMRSDRDKISSARAPGLVTNATPEANCDEGSLGQLAVLSSTPRQALFSGSDFDRAWCKLDERFNSTTGPAPVDSHLGAMLTPCWQLPSFFAQIIPNRQTPMQWSSRMLLASAQNRPTDITHRTSLESFCLRSLLSSLLL